MVVAPSALGSITPEIDARDMMEMAKLGAAHAAEKVLGSVRASAVLTAGFLMIDALDWKVRREVVPRVGFVSHQLRSLGDASANESG
jgi:hypothetical protein